MGVKKKPTLKILFRQFAISLIVMLVAAIIVPSGRRSEEHVDEIFDIFLSFAERRQLDRDDIESVVKVFAEFPGLYSFLQVSVRGCDDAHVDGYRLYPSEAFKGALLQHAKELHLQLGRYITYFIEEYGPAVCDLEAPRFR